jgi:ELWxxDGT repeat protein
MASPRLFNINPQTVFRNSSYPGNFIPVGNSLYFTADNRSTGNELWRSDGKTATPVADIYLGDLGSNPRPIRAIGNTLYFLATNSVSGRELWKTNGSTATLLADIFPGLGGRYPGEFAAIGNVLYFTAESPGTGEELWKTDGMTTTLVADIRPGPRSSGISNLTVVNDELIFDASDGRSGLVLWKTNGTGVTRISDVTPYKKFVVGNTLYFQAGNPSTGVELWRSDGTTSTPLPEINPGRDSSVPEDFTAFGPLLIFTAFNNQTGRELWKADGTSTTLLADARLGTGGSYPSEFHIAGQTLYFTAFSPANGGRRELWSTDGTTTQRLIDITPVNSSAKFLISSPFAVVGDTLYFRRFESSTGVELWKAKGNTVSRVSDLFSGPGSSNPDSFIAAGRTLFFTAETPSTGRELWKTDGVTTTLLANIEPGRFSSNPQNFKLTKHALYFTASESNYGRELWSTDGFTTARVADINPSRSGSSGGRSSDISDLNVAGNTLFFTANDGRNGRELWALDMAAPKVTISVPAVATTLVEGLTTNTVASIKVSLNAALFEDVSVSYTTTDGTARAGTDYTAIAGTLLIPAGTKSATISVPITNNNTNDPNRSFALRLSSPLNASLGTSVATITITDTLSSSTSKTLPAGVENLSLTGTAPINGTGNAGSNVLTGNSASNVLRGLGGDDRLRGGFGIDRLDGGAGSDTADFSDKLTSVVLTLKGANLVTALVSGLAEDQVVNIENINGGKAADTLRGDALENTLSGNQGNDTLNGGGGADLLIGGSGNDLHIVGFQQSLLAAPDHISDLVIGSDKIDLLSASGAALAAPLALSRATDATGTTLAEVVSSVFADANGLVNGDQPLGIRSAALVVASSLTPTATYLVINDAVAGFQASTDLIIDITGHTGNLPGLGTISVNQWFV